VVASLAQDGRSPAIYGLVQEAGVTDAAGASPQVTAEVGYGPQGSDPTSQAGWRFFAASFNAACTTCGTSDEYMGSFDLPAPGLYAFTYRVSLDGGLNHTYCDLDGAGSQTGLTFSSSQLGTLEVDP
jgi:hypothetical protein